MKPTLLVIGVRADSLGQAVAHTARKAGWSVFSAGVNDEDYRCDVASPGEVRTVVRNVAPHSVVCTAGINMVDTWDGWRDPLTQQLRVNLYGPLNVLEAWLYHWSLNGAHVRIPHHYVAISSNSAHVPRSSSLGYCASKAALSMALRCAARDLARRQKPFVVYGYEPGWIEGTPMSDAVRERLGDDKPAHRIPGGVGVDVEALAHMIVSNINKGPATLNGCMFRVDGGEQ